MNTPDGTQQLYDIYEMWHLPFWQTREFWITIITISGIVIALVVAWLLRLYILKKKNETPWDKALRELSRLSLPDTITKEQAKQFYFSVTAILKNYFNRRYLINSKGKTDQELIHMMEEVEVLHANLLPFVRTIFAGCSQIKYADEHALKEQVSRDLDNAIILIKETSEYNS